MSLGEYLRTAPHEEGEPTIPQIKAVLGHLRTHLPQYHLPDLSVTILVNRDKSLFIRVGNGHIDHLYKAGWVEGKLVDFERNGTEITN